MWYTIKSTEEWLSRLAAQYLGNASLWPQIFEANKDVIADPDKISVGMKIWIPIGGALKPEGTLATIASMPKGNLLAYSALGVAVVGVLWALLKK